MQNWKNEVTNEAPAGILSMRFQQELRFCVGELAFPEYRKFSEFLSLIAASGDHITVFSGTLTKEEIGTLEAEDQWLGQRSAQIISAKDETMSPASQPKMASHRLAAQQISAQLVSINSFGAFIKYLRERERLSPREFTASFPVYFEEHGATEFLINPDMYRKMEKGVRSPQYEELLPLYSALLGNGCKLTLQDCSAYVRLARLKIESLQKRRQIPRTTGEWRMLEVRLAQLGKHAEPEMSEQPFLRVLERRARPRLTFDISHIVGREDWLALMLSYLEESPKKMAVIRGMMGVGKTSGLKLLFQSLQEQDLYDPILYTFPPAGDMTATDHLQTFLATVLAELSGSEPETAKTIPLATQIAQVLARLKESNLRTILLLDDAQILLNAQGQLPAEWEQFLATYLEADHQTMLYLAAREWPLWLGSRSYLADGDDAVLPTLDELAGVQIWQRMGFVDVPEQLLAQAARKCGGNPLMIELRAAGLARPRFSFKLQQQQKWGTRVSSKNEHTRLIERLLEETHVFTTADVEVGGLLQQVVSRRLSQDALQLLETLAASPLALPFPLLAGANTDVAEYAFMEMVNSSLIDHTALSADRAALQPLAREASVQRLRAEGRLGEIERQLIVIYQAWLDGGFFQSEQEMGLLVTELAVLLLKKQALFEAAQLLVEHGWVSFAFGNGSRLARVTDSILATAVWRDGSENEIGGCLLHHYLGQYAGRPNKTAQRAEDYRHVTTIARTKQIPLSLPTEVQLFHYQLLSLLNQNRFFDAQQLLDTMASQIQSYQGTLTSVPFLSDMALFFGTWGDFAKEAGDSPTEREKREQAITAHDQAIAILERNRWGNTPLTTTRIEKDLARHLNNLSCHQVDLGHYTEAVPKLLASIELKRLHHALPYSLAAGLGELAQALAASGSYQKAILYSDEALALVQEAADTGNSIAQAELPVHRVNKARVLIRVGRWAEAEQLIQEAETQGIREERRIYRTYARDVRGEIQGCNQAALVLGRLYLDWRWLQRYRECIDYDVFGWLSHAGPFTTAEQAEWEKFFALREDAGMKQAMASLIKTSRDRELEAARRENREPYLCYPAIPVNELHSRLQRLSQLAQDVQDQEPNLLVRRLYLDAINEQLAWLHLVEAIIAQDSAAFGRWSRELYAETHPDEMRLAFAHLGELIRQGKGQERTAAVSARLSCYVQEWHLSACVDDFSAPRQTPETTCSSFSITHTDGRKIAPQVVKRFFEEVFRLYRIPNWQVILDRAANNLRIEQNIRALVLSDTSEMSVARVRELLSHEIECHVLRAVRGELSPLGLLGLGTRGALVMEEGLALYYDDQTARKIHGTAVDDSTPSTWLGTLAVGLACGVLTAPRTFAETLPFFEQVYFLIRLLSDETENAEKAFTHASRLAVNRCLRTYRGVPDLQVRGICMTKDVVYLRGLTQLLGRVQEDPQVIDRLLVGITGLEQLTDLADLGIVYPEVGAQWLAHRPDLDEYILSFQ